MALLLNCGRRFVGQALRTTGGITRVRGWAMKVDSQVLSPPPNGFHLVAISSHKMANLSALLYGSSSGDNPRITLMNHPKIVIGSPIDDVASVVEREIIDRFDKDFPLASFTQGARDALLTVSNILASDDISPLRDQELVDAAAFQEIKANHDKMTTLQRRQLRIREEDFEPDPLKYQNTNHLRLHFLKQLLIHKVSIIGDHATGLRAVEIMVVFIVPGLDPSNPSICNYGFFRDYSNKNKPSPWILKVVNYFKAVGADSGKGRKYNSNNAGKGRNSNSTEKGRDHLKKMKFWKRISIFIGAPAILLAGVNAYLGEMEQKSKPRPPFVAYEHLRIRNKPFPWGDGNKTLFHNPKVNALPEGYEDDED